MAKKDSDKASKEEIKEQKELEKQQMLKSKLRKKRMNQKIAKEEKRIKDIINLPFKILSISAFILTLLSFIVFYFWMNIDLKYSLPLCILYILHFVFGSWNCYCLHILYNLIQQKART
jgi:uncharacterized membrane protein